MDATPADRGTTRVLGLAFLAGVLVVVGAPFLSRLGWGRWGTSALGWVGVAGMIIGIGLRFWANVTLGTAYTRTLKILPGQAVISNGPYRVLRHPGYAGVLLMWLGAGLALENWITLTTIALVFGWAYRRRMNAEEAMLLARLGDAYGEYRRRTWRVVPLVY